MKKYAGEEFLNRLYKDLVHSDEVKHTAKGRNKNEDLAIYLERLEKITNEARDKNKLDLLKYFYYKKYIIKEEEVPESYFENLEQIALERGYGYIEYNKVTRQKEIDSIVTEQKETLDGWLEYFASEDTNHYPTWFKYYVFQNIMKIGYFDKEKNEFTKRTSSTVKPFIEINREAIAMLYDELYKYLDRQEITDTQLEQLIKNGSFIKIYSYIQRKLDEVKKSKSISNDGIWKKYERGSDPKILFNDIHGKGTGWCTAGGLETATSHLEGGDFHVYYTKDENGEYTIPRIAIRMELGKIGEIRGIAENQNLESEMESVVEEKLQEFPDKDEYKKKVSNMKMLTKIYNKQNNNENLTKEELRFLYEIDSEIIGFGYNTDPRIEEIKEERSIKDDLAFIYDIKPEEISLNEQEALEGNKKLHYGDLDYSCFLHNFKNVVFPQEIIGSLKINNIASAENVTLPKKVYGCLQLKGLISSKGLILPEYIGESLDLSRLPDANGIKFPKEVNGDLDLRSITTIEGLILPKKIVGYLRLTELTNAKGLVLPEIINGTLDLDGLESAEGLILPKEGNYSLWLNGITSASNLVLPYKMKGNLSLNGLTSAKDLVLPEIIDGTLELEGIEQPENLILPKEITGALNLDNLRSAENVYFSRNISSLFLNNLETAQGLILPENLESICINGVKSAKGLIIPKGIKYTLTLTDLIDPEGIILPKNEQGEFYISARRIYCPFSVEELIEAAKRTEARQKEPKIFEEIDDLSTGNPKK